MDSDQAPGLPLAEAARRLGISENALRKRVRRGTVEAVKGTDDRWYIYLPANNGQAADQASGQATARPSGQAPDALTDALREEVTWLREQLSRKDQTITALAARVADLAEMLPAIGAGGDAPQTRQDAPGATERRGPGQDAPRPWWRRLWERS